MHDINQTYRMKKAEATAMMFPSIKGSNQLLYNDKMMVMACFEKVDKKSWINS